MVSRLACVVASLLVLVGCASRAPRSRASDEPRPAPPGAVPADAALAAIAADTSEPAVAEPPAPRLPWVDPARCLSPCTYDPQAELVRVDDQAVVDPAGEHLVHRTVEEPLRALLRAARAAGHKLRVESAYRSYEYQAELFRKTKQPGRAARPGHSEHQLGTAVDLRLPTSAAIKWLAAHAGDHGFALSYPDGKQRITGYRPEPWHIRHVGAALVDELRATGGTLEEMFRARPALGESGACDDCPLALSRTPCGSVTAGGRCDGTVLSWCFDGALATVDCAPSKQRCGRVPATGDHDCITR
jgi:D-alanyl-D-alanine carboxypeptidase